MPAQARALAAQLHSFGWRDGHIIWTVPYLAAACGMAPRTLNKWLKILMFFEFVRSIRDMEAPSGRRLVLTWLVDPWPKHINDGMEMQLHAPAPLITNSLSLKATEIGENKEGARRQRPEPSPESRHQDPSEAQDKSPKVEVVQDVQKEPEAPRTAAEGLDLTSQERERLSQLSPGSQAQLTVMLRRGIETEDDTLVKEAKNRLRPVAPEKPEPETTLELIHRVHERPDYVPRLAATLQKEMKDTATKQWHLWLRVAQGLANRLVDVDAVVRLYEYALDARDPGHYFARGWARL